MTQDFPNIQEGEEPTEMPFGKYRNVSIAAVATRDPSYLNWVLDNLKDLNAPTRSAIQKTLNATKANQNIAEPAVIDKPVPLPQEGTEI